MFIKGIKPFGSNKIIILLWCHKQTVYSSLKFSELTGENKNKLIQLSRSNQKKFRYSYLYDLLVKKIFKKVTAIHLPDIAMKIGC